MTGYDFAIRVALLTAGVVLMLRGGTGDLLGWLIVLLVAIEVLL